MAVAALESLSYWYPNRNEAALEAVDLELNPGLHLVAGTSGGGKSSLLRVLNGLIPHFHGGRIAGAARVHGQDVFTTPTRRLAERVGFVFQDPEAQMVYGRVDREVAFGLENLGVDRPTMRARVEAALDRVGIGALAQRRLSTLSGGERQRVALASALAMGQDLVVLDEPTSQLDPDGSDRLIGACLRLVEEGMTVVVSEHRLELLLPRCETLLLVRGGRVSVGPPVVARLRELPSVPALITLGLRLGWDPIPLEGRPSPLPALVPTEAPHPRQGVLAWEVRDATIGHRGGADGAEIGDLAGAEGEVVVLMGPNGGGKTTLLRTIAGLIPPIEGRVWRREGRIAYLPQDPAALLYRASLLEEVRVTLDRAGETEPPERVLAALNLLEVRHRYPRDLSCGERQRGALAAVLAGTPRLALLDEPTRGMDGPARAALRRLIEELKGRGSAIVLATHDVDLAAEVGDRIVRVGDGRIQDLGSPDLALSGEGELATQIGRLYPGGPVTVEGVLARL